MKNSEVVVVKEGTALQAESLEREAGNLFVSGDEKTYPPEFTFVVINVLPNVPVYYDRKQNVWLTPIAEKGMADIYARNDLFFFDEDEGEIYWQPIQFKKSDVLFIPSDKDLTN